MTITNARGQSRRVFLAGATSTAISALVAGRVPLAVAASSDPPKAGDALKLITILRKRSDLSIDEFNDYWLNRHAPLAREAIKQLGGFRYIQSHTEYSELTTLDRAQKGQTDAPYEGVTEVWFPSEDALNSAIATPEGIEANARLARDELNFIDGPRSSYFFAREYPILGDLSRETPPTDNAVGTSLASTSFGRTSGGARRLNIHLKVDEPVSVRALLLRRNEIVGYAHGPLKPGRRTLTLDIKSDVGGGAAVLELIVSDASANSSIKRRRVRVPQR